MRYEKIALFVPDQATVVVFAKALLEQTAGEINIMTEFDQRILNSF